MDAAATVFAHDGFHAASLDDVAALAGFTKGAVYSNFKSKDDLFLAVFDHRLDREAEEMASVLEQESGGESGQLPQVQSVIERTWDDEWTALYLEFVLYAETQPRSRGKARGERAASTRVDDRHARTVLRDGGRRARHSDPGTREDLDGAVRRARSRPARRSTRVRSGDAH